MEEDIAKVRMGAWWNPLRFTPKVRERVCGVALAGTLCARQERFERAAMLESTAQRAASAPPAEFQEGTTRYVVPGSISAVRECDSCMRGEMSCVRCGGSGVHETYEVYETEQGTARHRVQRPCPDCRSTGTVLCTICEGSLSVVDVELGICTDERVRFDYTYLPDLPFELEEALYDVFENHWFSWPALQEVPVQESVIADPYRGSTRKKVVFDFHGFDYAEALSEARAAVEAKLNGRVPFSIDARVHVIPMIIADHGRTPAAHFCFGAGIVSVSKNRQTNLPARRPTRSF